MKRLKKEMFFRYLAEERVPITDETTWAKTYLHDHEKIPWRPIEGEELSRFFLVARGVDFNSGSDFYSSDVGKHNPLADLPCVIAIERINRAAEELGILEDELKPLCSFCKEEEAKYGCEACNNIVCKDCSHRRGLDFRFCSDCVNPDRK